MWLTRYELKKMNKLRGKPTPHFILPGLTSIFKVEKLSNSVRVTICVVDSDQILTNKSALCVVTLEGCAAGKLHVSLPFSSCP